MLRSVAVIMRGTVLAQLVGFLVLPILSRNFSPVAFGNFQIFQSLLGIALVAATFRYEVAILRAETPRELGAILTLCAGINLFLAMLFSVIYSTYHAFIDDSSSVVPGLPFSIFVGAFVAAGTLQYLGYFLVREELFSETSNSKIIQALSNAGTALALAIVNPLSIGIIAADIVGRAGGVFAMLSLSFQRLRASIARPSRTDIIAAAKRFRQYPFVAFPGGLVNMAGAALTPIMIYRTFDAATSGQFGLLERSATLPIGLLGVSISQVYMAHLASDLRAGDRGAFRRFCRLIALLALISVPPAILMAILAPWLFAFIFGPGWEQAAIFARLMMPAYCLAVLSGATGMTLTVIGWQKTQLAWETARLVVMVALWIGGSRLGWGIQTMVAGHSAVLSIFAAIMIALSAWAVLSSTNAAKLAADGAVKKGTAT